jgi:hypothetical protein
LKVWGVAWLATALASLVSYVAPRVARWWHNPEVIGDAACPVLLRWMLFTTSREAVTLPDGSTSTHSHKVMLHRFLPNSHDRDTHDHPWPFVTVVLRGMYEDLTTCECMRPGAVNGGGPWLNCPKCNGSGYTVEIMRAPCIRYRKAEHAHITRTRAEGAWTLVVTGRAARVWGFWVGDAWVDWRTYTSVYGSGMVCDDGE